MDFDLKCYNKHCFELFGADIMITHDFRIKLLEINDRIALKLSDKKLNYYWGCNSIGRVYALQA